jgi:hypothetical protein
MPVVISGSDGLRDDTALFAARDAGGRAPAAFAPAANGCDRNGFAFTFYPLRLKSAQAAPAPIGVS